MDWLGAGKFPLYLAPMAGVTDRVFRRLCRRTGADVLVTEFVSAEGICHRNERTREMVSFGEDERPIGVQIFGANPDSLAEAARQVVEWVQPDFIDLNFGCPVNKVVCRHGGSALLKDCSLLERVARAVVAAVPEIPVTAKIRIGWSKETINATTTARLLEAAGIAAVAVHGRTKEQGYSGEADWGVIAAVAEAVKIPVIGNGDIRSIEDVQKRRAQSRIAGVMIGRAAMHRPWLFGQIQHFFRTGEVLPEPNLTEQWAWILNHCRLHVAQGEERPKMHAFRARLMAYTKGMPGGRWLRTCVQGVESVAELESLARRHLEELGLENKVRAGIESAWPFGQDVSTQPPHHPSPALSQTASRGVS